MILEPSPTVQPLVPREPTWVERAHAALLSDLSVHGLAYLGVLLLFAGVVGFVVFAFGDVDRAWRPLAELLVPLALFAGGWELGRRGSTVVGSALVFSGGAVLPVVAIATLVDGAGIPPDPHTSTLAAGATCIPLAIAAAYAWIGTRHPSSPLRYLAAPTLWVAVAMAALLPRAHELTGWVGGHLASPTGGGQAAAVLVAIGLTAVACRARPDHPLSRPSQVAVLVGLPLAVALAVLVGARDGWPLVPVLVSCGAVAVAAEGLAPVLPSWLVGVAQPLAVAAPLLVPGTSAQVGWLAAGIVVAELALLEWEARVRPEPWPLVASGGAAVGALAMTAVEPTAMLAAAGAALGWAVVRFTKPLAPVPPAVPAVALATLPLVVAADLARLTDPPTAAILAATGVLVVAAALRLTPAGRYGRWQWWVVVAASITGAAVAAIAQGSGPTWLLAAASLAAGTAVALTSTPVPLRTWLVTAAGFLSGAVVLGTVDASQSTVAVTLGVAGLLLAQATWLRGPAVPHLSAIGLGTGAVAIAVAAGPQQTTLDVALALAVGAWLLTSLAAETGRWALGRWLVDFLNLDGELDPALVPEAVTLAGLPALTLVVLHDAGLLTSTAVPAGLALSALGLACSAGTRLVHRRRGLAWMVAAFALAEVLAGAGLAWASPGPALAASLVVVAAVAAAHPSVRPPSTWWLAWAATGAATLAAARLADVPTDRLAVVALGWGGLLALGALGADEVAAGRRPGPGWIRTGWLLPPAWLGSLTAAIALGAIVAVPDPAWTWYCLAAAAGITVAAVLTRTGGVTAGAWVTGLAAAAGLAPQQVLDTPWAFVAAGAGIGVVSALLELTTGHDRPWWARWDLPAFVAANLVALVGIVTVRTPHEIVVTWAPAGALSLAVAWWKRNLAWLAAGAFLLVSAGVAAGPAWRTGAFALLAVAALAASRSVDPPLRPVAHLVSAAATGATWWSLVAWQAWADTTVAVASALAAGLLALAVASGLRWLEVRLEEVWPWLLLAVAGLVACIALTSPADQLPTGLALATGLALVAVATGLAAAPLGVRVLRPAAAVLGLAAAGTAGWAVETTPTQAVAASVTVALGAALAGLALHRRRLDSLWLLPVDLVAATAGATAIVAGAMAWPDRTPLTVALAVVGGVLALAGVVRDRWWLVALVPVVEVAAWVAGAGAVLRGEPVWLLLPVGAGLLVEAALVRRGQSAEYEIDEVADWIEVTGMAMLVGPALVATVTDTLAWVLLAVALGVGLGAWGVLTRTRRRLAAGAGTVLLAVGLALLVPLAGALPTAGSGALFLALAGAGVLAIALATFLESGRARVGHAVEHLRDLTRGWS